MNTHEIVEEIIKKICSKSNVVLHDVEIRNTQKGKVLIVYITKSGGVAMEDCVTVSRLVSEELDALDIFKDHYFLEVSSPGLERSLKLKKHYQGAIGEDIKLTYSIDKVKKTVRGKLNEVRPDEIEIFAENDEILVVPFSNIKKAKTVI